MAARLSNVVETAEQTRKSYKTTPTRVVIDTSFVDQNKHKGSEAAVDADTADVSDAVAEVVQGDAVSATPVSDAEQDVFPRNKTEVRDGEATHAGSVDAIEVSGNLPAENEELSLLDEALALLEQAEHREAEAIQEIATLQTRVQALEAGQVAGREAQAAGKTASSEELVQMQSRIAELESELNSELSARVEAETHLEQAIEAAEALHQAAVDPEALEDLKVKASQFELAAEREQKARREAEAKLAEALECGPEGQVVIAGEELTAAQNEIAELKERAKQLEAAASCEQVERLKLEAELEDALAAANDAKDKPSADALSEANARIEDLGQALAALEVQLADEKSGREAAEAGHLVALEAATAAASEDAGAELEAALEEIAWFKANAEEFEKSLAQEQAARTEVEEILEVALQDADGAREEVGKQHAVLDAAIVEASEARAGEAAAIVQLEELRVRVCEVESAVEVEKAAHREAGSQLVKAIAVAEDAQAQITTLKDALGKAEQAGVQAADVADRESALAANVESLEAQLLDARSELAKTHRQLDEAINAVEQALSQSNDGDLIALQQLAEETQAALAKEQENRLDLEARLDLAQTTIARFEQQIAEVEEATRGSAAESDQSPEVAEKLAAFEAEVAELRQRADQFEANVTREQVARLAAEDARDEAQATADSAGEQMIALQNALEEAQQSLKAYANAAVAAGSKKQNTGADLRFAADKLVFMKASKKAKTADAAQQDSAKSSTADSPPKDDEGKAKRIDKRVSTRINGTIQKDTELTVLDCSNSNFVDLSDFLGFPNRQISESITM